MTTLGTSIKNTATYILAFYLIPPVFAVVFLMVIVMRYVLFVSTNLHGIVDQLFDGLTDGIAVWELRFHDWKYARRKRKLDKKNGFS